MGTGNEIVPGKSMCDGQIVPGPRGRCTRVLPPNVHERPRERPNSTAMASQVRPDRWVDGEAENGERMNQP